jgi:hypothetical protein
MKIANPVYDVTFKYLMEDNDIAKDIISAIVQESVINLDLQPQEIITNTAKGLRIVRIDFKATTKNNKGESKDTIIEIQKKNEFKDKDLERFRLYLGEAYLSKAILTDEKGKQKSQSLPITSIYFLGFRLKGINLPVLKVGRQFIDGITNKIYETKGKNSLKSHFVEQLSHDMYVIQIPRLKMNVTTEAEQILDVFNQNKYKTDDPHFLNYTGDTSNPKVERIVKRLYLANIDFDTIRRLQFEEEINEELAEGQAAIDALLDARNEKEEALKAKEEERKAKEEERKAKENAIQEKEQILIEKEKLLQALEEERKAKKEAILQAQQAQLLNNERFLALEKKMAELIKKLT